MTAEVSALARIGAGHDAYRSRPVDLVHLARQTLGDRHLEREILDLFVRQARAQFARLAAARETEERRQAAHLIKGSARGIGAWPIARIAGEIEAAPAIGNSEIAAMGEAIDEASAFILHLLED